jgi:hypothetical protein
MTLFSRAAAGWDDGSGYGPLVLTPIMHPGAVATLLPWTSGGLVDRRPAPGPCCQG